MKNHRNTLKICENRKYSSLLIFLQNYKKEYKSTIFLIFVPEMRLHFGWKNK